MSKPRYKHYRIIGQFHIDDRLLEICHSIKVPARLPIHDVRVFGKRHLLDAIGERMTIIVKELPEEEVE